MIIRTTKSFDKQFAKLRPSLKLQFKIKLEIFRQNTFDSRLRNHALTGKYKSYRSINVTGDVRALYTEKDDQIIIFGFIGRHAQLHK